MGKQVARQAAQLFMSNMAQSHAHGAGILREPIVYWFMTHTPDIRLQIYEGPHPSQC